MFPSTYFFNSDFGILHKKHWTKMPRWKHAHKLQWKHVYRTNSCMPNKGLNSSCDWTINNRSDWIMVQSHHTPSQILFCYQNNLLSITFHTQTSGIQMQDNTTAFVITFICMCKELHCIAAASIFITDILHQFPRKWKFCSLEHTR